MASLNRATLIGNLGRDPEVRYTQDGKAVASFSIATTDKWRDKATGENREKTEWHRIVAFGRLGEICGEYLAKGRQVFIEGRLRTRSWEKDGITRYTTEIEATTMQMLGSRENTGSYQGGGNSYQQGQQKQQNQNSYNQGGPQDNFDPHGGFQGGQTPPPPDDDIPF